MKIMKILLSSLIMAGLLFSTTANVLADDGDNGK